MNKIKKVLGSIIFILVNPIDIRFYNRYLGDFFILSRIKALRLMGMKIGNNTRVHSNFYTNNPSLISIGNNCEVGRHSEIWAYSQINIGDSVEIGSRLYMNSSNHNFTTNSKVPLSKQGAYSLPISIDKNIWVGANVNILAGVYIEKDVVVGANSVVNKNLTEGFVYAGSPARKINEIK
jgi:maltose O-acetyltransferase